MRLSLRLILASLALLTGCATAPKPSNPILPDKCGNPCAAVSCPSAFRCDVDASCQARCQPEPAPRSY